MNLNVLDPFKHWAQNVWSSANDHLLGISTEPNSELDPPADPQRTWRYAAWADRSSHRDSFNYRPADYLNIWRVLRVLSPGKDDVFYDIGCGKGRVVCVAATRSLRRVIGVELSEPLCSVARSNTERLRGRKAPVEIRCEDAAVSDLSDGTIYFMFNPFEEATMRDVLANMQRSLKRRQRRVTIVYYNARYDGLIRSSGFPVITHELKTFGGNLVRFYANATRS